MLSARPFAAASASKGIFHKSGKAYKTVLPMGYFPIGLI